MRRLGLFAMVLLLPACTQGMFRRGPTPNAAIEAQYAKAMTHLDPANARASLDTAVQFLDAYLAHAGYVQHRSEAAALRRLAASAQQLERVQDALQQARARATERRVSDGEVARPDDDSVKEIQRLKEELAKANAELERIKKRLATPKP